MKIAERSPNFRLPPSCSNSDRVPTADRDRLAWIGNSGIRHATAALEERNHVQARAAAQSIEA
jgi:hypothetical protein